ncbi:phage tail protein [Lachnospiraceae bacterium OttesenSCG-928-D06]|nr:phage tail protein [Lachnospiraceae bacterium OttesenSCG-928-D06]
MGAFKSAVITKKGQALLAKVVAGTTTLNFTNIKVSEQVLSGDLASLTGIGTVKQTEKVASVIRQNTSNVKVSASFSNQNLTAGYYVRNIGLYATDPQDGEILYSISVADETTATADWMPPFNGIGVSSLLVDLVTAVSNASSVSVTVDPSAGATVAQIVNLQGQIDDVRSFVGYEEDDVYGVEVDYANKKFSRIAGAEHMVQGSAFSALSPWDRKRCILSDGGVVLAYRGETGYVETGKLTTAITKTVKGVETTFPAGTVVQVMVEQPVFYTKVVPIKSKTATSGRGKQGTVTRYYISPTPKVGFKAPEVFYDDNGNLQDKIYLSAYEGALYDTSASKYITDDAQVADFANDVLGSIAGAKPMSGLTQNLTRANTRALATKRGAGWRLHNIFALSVTQWLILVEYASFNAQSNIGQGVSTFTDNGTSNMALNTGATAGIGNGSGIPDGGTDGKCSVTYRGEENLWGNIWTWLDGINIYNTVDESTAYVKSNGAMTDDTRTGYTPVEFGLVKTEGYISAFGVANENNELFLPTEHSGTSALPVSDYIWNNNTGWRVAELGGGWSVGARCGAWCLSLGSASSGRYRYVSGRLLYVPQSTSV